MEISWYGVSMFMLGMIFGITIVSLVIYKMYKAQKNKE